MDGEKGRRLGGILRRGWLACAVLLVGPTIPGDEDRYCRDGMDNDLDGEIDCADEDCAGPQHACGGCNVGFSHFLRGDVDDSGTVDIADAIGILDYLFLRGRAPECLVAADADDSGRVDVTDAVRILGYLFDLGFAPEAPFPTCGVTGPGENQPLPWCNQPTCCP